MAAGTASGAGPESDISADQQANSCATHPVRVEFDCTEGVLVVTFDEPVLQDIGWSFAAQDKTGASVGTNLAKWRVEGGSAARIRFEPDASLSIEAGLWKTAGGLLLSVDDQRVAAIGGFELRKGAGPDFILSSTIGAPGTSQPVFVLSDVRVEVLNLGRQLRIEGSLRVEESWARSLGLDDAVGRIIGRIELESALTHATGQSATRALSRLDSPGPVGSTTSEIPSGFTSIGPDIIVRDLYAVENYGSVGDISAFAIGTQSCNIGDLPASWYANTNEHPVIAQNLYRYKDGQFEQVGMSWLKHGFVAASGGGCGIGCLAPPEPGNQLGIGCSDPYSATLNGQQSNLGPRSQVNAHTGVFTYPFSAGSPAQVIGRRLQVHNDDLNPALNGGALYFIEGHYVTQDDALAGNGNNNASYRRVSITDALTHYEINLITTTVRQKPAIRAWQDYFSQVNETDIQVPDDGLFILSSDATDIGGGFWRYEYALYNMNADRAARAFEVPVEPGTVIQNVGFHDVDYHSGEPYGGNDWSASIQSDRIIWSTQDFATNPNANALRWGTLYNFRFDADQSPNLQQATIELFKPGTPGTVQGLAATPTLPPPQCGNNTIENGEECDPPDGVVCDSGCQSIANNGLRGGLLWDRWWTVNGSETPPGDHPLYPQAGQQSGSTTYRCKECHGWDYKGASGAYGSGTHFTGIAGVFGSTKTPLEMFNIIQSSTVPNGHGFRDLGVSDQDARDLVQFMLDLAIDTDTYVDAANGAFLGDPGVGLTHYTAGGSIACAVCHGADGTAINFGTRLAPEWVGTIAVGNPWELLHKIRFGNPGTSMPSWIGTGGTDQGAADIGRYAQLNLPDVCEVDAHCDDGLFCNGPETCDQGTCVAGAVPCPEQPCDESGDVCGQADPYRGGKLYDNWLEELVLPAPPGDHPLYPPAGAQSGSATFLCVECHGWDYAGAGGAYASGPHFTGIGGVLASALTPGEMFDLLKRADVPDGHGYGDYGLTDTDIWDLAAFVTDLAIDTTPYIDSAGVFLGSSVQGQVNYTSGGVVACTVCHGPDGTNLDFGTPGQPKWIGTIAVDDPWQLLHKIRMGTAGGPMPSWTLHGGTDQGAADIGTYAQQFLPVDCVVDGDCDDGLFCTGVETCDGRFCLNGTEPCTPGLCDESVDLCLSGQCATPAVAKEGSRHVKITPVAGAVPVALLVTGDPDDANVACVSKYVAADGSLITSPVFRLPSEWGSVAVRGVELRPETTYRVRSDCGSPGQPDWSFAASATTGLWCDIDGNQHVNGIDIQLMVKAFQHDYSQVSLEKADVHPCLPDGVVNGNDIQRGIQAFQRMPFEVMNCAQPCP